jgi:hypothetical protein
VAISAKAAPVLVERPIELLKKLLEFGHFWGYLLPKGPEMGLLAWCRNVL